MIILLITTFSKFLILAIYKCTNTERSLSNAIFERFFLHMIEKRPDWCFYESFFFNFQPLTDLRNFGKNRSNLVPETNIIITVSSYSRKLRTWVIIKNWLIEALGRAFFYHVQNLFEIIADRRPEECSSNLKWSLKKQPKRRQKNVPD